ncbi:MAG: tRNA glutamyl-Q(34) synthetase GluQRS [Actinomycetota bacterium]
MSRGRFAPSPTGTLHIGNLRTALAAWLTARHAGSEFLLRFEDLDAATARPEHEAAQRRDLERLGLDWDHGPVRQSERLDRYADTLADLERAGVTYRCWCSRREIREAPSAPHLPPGHYPGTCRDLSARQIAEREATGKPPALRLRTDHPEVTILDQLHGEHTETVDDLVLRRGDGTPAYNLVVVIDDSVQGVEEVVRADDLLASTPRQAYLQQLLDLVEPRWLHVPLVLSPDGSRLAKRDGAVTLDDRLAVGDTPERVVAVLAASLGLEVDAAEITPRELIDAYAVASLDAQPWTVTHDQIEQPW